MKKATEWNDAATPSDALSTVSEPDAPFAKIRVAMLITELARGGAEKALLQLATTLDLTRFEPVVFSLSGLARDLENSLVPLFRDAGIETIELGLTGLRNAPSVFRRLTRELRRRQVDVLQSFMFHANLFGRFAGRAAGVPVVCSGIRVAERDAPRRLALDRWTRSLVDAWVCVGEATADFSRTVGRLPKERVLSIPNGVRVPDLESLETTNANADFTWVPEPFGRRKRIVCVGRLTPQKGFDRFLENAATWAPRIANDWEIWIVGDGPERDALRRIVETNGLANVVFFAGWRPNVPGILASADLFALPSRWEGMPNALLEAASVGKAALCSDVEGVAEIFGNDTTSQICAFDDDKSWRDKILALTNDAALRDELGRRNRNRVAQEFRVESATRKYEALWTRLLAEKQDKTTRRR
ncbi:MAG: glycosyltransferase [Thermoguttaceae bacterium]|nr:glycosyltransferase [Thermoguttaceae bacterium]